MYTYEAPYGDFPDRWNDKVIGPWTTPDMAYRGCYGMCGCELSRMARNAALLTVDAVFYADLGIGYDVSAGCCYVFLVKNMTRSGYYDCYMLV